MIIPVKPYIMELYDKYDRGVIADHELQSSIFQLITPENVADIMAFVAPSVREEMVTLARFTPRGQTFRSMCICMVRSAADDDDGYEKREAERVERYTAGVFAVKDYDKATCHADNKERHE